VVTALLVTGARLSPPFAELCERSLLPGPLLDLVAGTLPEEGPPPAQQPDGESPAEDEAKEESSPAP
jgi:hypothetical protein